MRPGTVIGALLILAGVIALSVGGFSFTTRDKVAEVGPVQVTTERERSVPLSPVLSGLAIAAGVVLIVASSRKAR
jgi:drug/metabolite transporter (DMT)-like permease